MPLSTEQYLAIASLAYNQKLGDISLDKPQISKLIDSKLIDTSKLELRALASMSDWVLVNVSAHQTASGMSAIAVYHPQTKELVIAYRGTDDAGKNRDEAFIDYEADLAIMYGGSQVLAHGMPQFKDANDFYRQTVAKLGGSNISKRSFTGHSLGGGLAQYMAYETGGVHQTVTFDAVGIGQLLPGVNPRDFDHVVTDYVNENDIIGLYGIQLGKTVYIKDMNSEQSRARRQQARAFAMGVSRKVAETLAQGEQSAEVLGAGIIGVMKMNEALDEMWQNASFDPHWQSSLLDENGNLGPAVDHPNPFMQALASSTTHGLNFVTDITENSMRFAVEFVDIGAEVVVTIANGAATVVFKTVDFTVEKTLQAGQVVGDIIHTIGSNVGNALYDAWDVVQKLPDSAMQFMKFAFQGEVLINGTVEGESIIASDVIRKRFPLLGYQEAMLKSVTILADLGDDTVDGTNKEDLLDGGAGNDRVSGSGGRDIIMGGYGDDTLFGGDGSDRIFGGHGDDVLYGRYEGNIYFNGHDDDDILEGGAGNDRMLGGLGNDTYRFGRGYGKDVIEDRQRIQNYSAFASYSSAGANDKIAFLSGITPDDIEVHRIGHYDLELRLKGTDETLTIVQYFDEHSKAGPGAIEHVVFADGTEWTKEDLMQKARVITRRVLDGMPEGHLGGYHRQDDIIYGTAADNRIGSASGDDLIYGDAGDDIIIAGSGDDTIFGGAGNDKLYGDTENSQTDYEWYVSRNDTLDGGEGDDLLVGASGDDVYIFGRGYGKDTIVDRYRSYSYESYRNAGNDEIRFKEGITPDDIKVHRFGSGIRFTIKDTGDSITADHFFDRYVGAGAIEKVTFTDGTVWDLNTLLDKARYIDELVPHYKEGFVLAGHHFQNNIITDSERSNIIHGGNYNDTFIFGKNSGQDVIKESAGRDVVIMDRNYKDIAFNLKDSGIDIGFIGSTDTLHVYKAAYRQEHQIEEYRTNEGYSISGSNVTKLIQAMASFGYDHGMTWRQAVEAFPTETDTILSRYWTAPTA